MIKLQEYQPGETVLNAGQLGKGFCILEEGTLEVIRDEKVLSEIDTKGSIFGELSEILGLKRDADIRAKTLAKVRHVEENISDIVSKNPKVAVKLIKTLGRRLYRMNRIASKEAATKETHVETSHGIEILVVDDKPNIITQISDICAKSNWVVKSAADDMSALRACNESSFNAILISMALPNDMAIDLRRKLKTTHKVVSTPVIGMIVKGDESSLKKALNAGFSECIEKPFDSTKTEATLYKVMNLDSSARYFSFEKDYLLFKVPSELTDFVITDIKDNMDERIKNTINEGIGKLIIDVSSLDEIEEEAIEVVGEFAEKIEDLSLPMQGAIIAKGDDAEMWNNLDGCEEWQVFNSLDKAIEALSST